MADQTIYGCYNSSTGAVTFAGAACDSGDYTGCYVASGEHAGQIAVPVSEESCNDTYYGCLNFATGQFQLVIPDNCCGWFPCVGCVLPPAEILVSFQDVLECYPDGGGAWQRNFSINNVWTLPQIAGQSWYGNSCCAWGLILPNYCHQQSVSYNYALRLTVHKISGTKGHVEARICKNDARFGIGCSDGDVFTTSWGGYTTELCVQGTSNNGLIFEDCDDAPSMNCCDGNCFTYDSTCGIQGVATVVEVCPEYQSVHYYNLNDVIDGTDSNCYKCIVPHDAFYEYRPISGPTWETYWELV